MIHRTKAESVKAAAEVIATGSRIADESTPRQVAEAAWHVGCGSTVDELEDRERARRGLPSREAIRRAGEVLATAIAATERMTPREQAEAAYTPTGPSVDVLEDRIRARRGLPPIDRGSDAQT